MEKRVILVTGAGGGIGAAMCAEIANAETALVMCDHADGAPLQEAADAARAKSADVAVAVGDLVDPETPARLVAEAINRFGRLDGVVSNAGIAGPGWLDQVTLDDWERVFAVNLRACWLLARASFEHLQMSNGAFIATASVSGMAPQHGMGLYNLTKSGVIMLGQTLAQEWGQFGVRVNTISPGFIRSPLTEATYADPEKHAARAALVPYGRIGNPADIAKGVHWLLSEDADYVTGHNLVIDGGFSGTVNRQIGAVPRTST